MAKPRLLVVEDDVDISNMLRIFFGAQGYDVDMREAQELAKWHIHHIREMVETDVRNPEYIINIRGKGYRLVMG